jgi:transcriptional regulator with XRE-family HTH domain
MNRLRESREYAGFTREEVAGRLKIPVQLLDMIESGKVTPYPGEIAVLVDLYRRSAGVLMGTEDPPAVTPAGVDVEPLCPEDRAEVERFAEFLHWRRKRDNRPDAEES